MVLGRERCPAVERVVERDIVEMEGEGMNL
jgi:hypothetical protein